jgi:hypothetical protein
MTESRNNIGLIVQLCGLGAFGVGVVLSIHHIAVAAFFVAGAAAFYVGKKIRSLA